MASDKKKKVAILIGILIDFILLTPIAIYIYKFGFHISSNHTRWAEMGSAMAGIYAPILALLTLFVIVAQLRIQADINNHQHDQDYIKDCREDIHFYLTSLAKSLKEEGPSGKTIREMLHDSFQPAHFEDLSSSEFQDKANSFNKISPEIYNYWSSLYPIIIGLRSNPNQPYSVNAVGAISKFIAVLTFETCVSLDNYLS
jgi:hypothetical protein